MKIKRTNGWQLVICLIVVGLDSPAEGCEACVRPTPLLNWDTRVDKGVYRGDDLFTFTLRDVAKRDPTLEHVVTLYQQLKGGGFKDLKQLYPHIADYAKLGEEYNSLEWGMLGKDFVGDTRIVKAQIKYSDGVMVKSKTLDLENPTAQGEYSAGTLEWKNSLKVDLNGDWEIQLKDVPLDGHTGYSVTLYQLLEGDQWKELQKGAKFNNPPEKNTIKLTFPVSKLQGDSKIVMAEVTYPDNSMVESKTFNLQQLVETASIVGLIVGCVVGGVCLIALVVGCIWYKKRRQRRVPLQQPIPVMGQGQQNQVQQMIPQDQYV